MTIVVDSQTSRMVSPRLTSEAGVPRQRQLKDLIRVGRYVKVEDDIEFTVTPDVLRHWVDTFNAMTANGVRVPLTGTHEDAGLADDAKGWVEALWIEGETLWATVELIGADAIEAAERNNVSIFVPHEFTDGTGNRYSRPIVHVAITNKPLIPGLGQFIPIAAAMANSGRRPKMTELMKKLAELLGVEAKEGMSEDDFAASMLDAVGKLKKAPVAAAASEGEGEEEEDDDEEKKKAVAASRRKGKGKAPDAMLVRTVGTLRTTQLNGLVASGKLSAAARDKIAEQFIGADNAAIAASLAGGDDGRAFDAIVSAIEINEPLRLGHATGRQFATIPDPNASGGGKNPLVEEAERRAALAARK